MDRKQAIQQMSDSHNELRRAMQVYSAEHFTHDGGPSLVQLGVLKAIYCKQPISHKALASKMQLTPGAISQLIEGLDHAGCIIRTASETDRRVSYLSVSREGKRVLDSFDKFRETLLVDATRDLPDSDLISYVNVQKALTIWLEDHSNSKHKENI